MDADIWNQAFYDNGEWVSWSAVEEQLQYQEWRANYPNAIHVLRHSALEILHEANVKDVPSNDVNT
jgi:hypothetical protein